MRWSVFLFALPVLAWVAGGCISTSVVHSTNVYQSGRTAGKGGWQAGGDVTIAPQIVTDADSSGLRTRVGSDDVSLSAGLWGQYGVADAVDLGFDFEFTDPGKFGLRPFVKIGLSDPERKLAIALLPAAVYLQGEKSEEGTSPHFELESSAWGGELHLPISYLTRHVEIDLTPRFVYMKYAAPFDYIAATPGFDRSVTDRKEVIAGGVALGLRCRFVHPQASVLFSKYQPMYELGLSLHAGVSR